MIRFLKDLKKSMLVSAFCGILAGLVMLLAPDTVAQVICLLCGALLALCGLAWVVAVFVRPEGKFAVTRMIPGVLAIAVGLEFLFRGEKIFEILWFFIGLILLVDAVYKIQYASELRAGGVNKWWLLLPVALAALILSIVLMIQPVSGERAMILLSGAFLLSNGVGDLFTSVVIAVFADALRANATAESSKKDTDLVSRG